MQGSACKVAETWGQGGEGGGSAHRFRRRSRSDAPIEPVDSKTPMSESKFVASDDHLVVPDLAGTETCHVEDRIAREKKFVVLSQARA